MFSFSRFPCGANSLFDGVVMFVYDHWDSRRLYVSVGYEIGTHGTQYL